MLPCVCADMLRQMEKEGKEKEREYYARCSRRRIIFDGKDGLTRLSLPLLSRTCPSHKRPSSVTLSLSLHAITALCQLSHSPNNAGYAQATRTDSQTLGTFRKFCHRRSHGDSTSGKSSTLSGLAVSAPTSCTLSWPPRGLQTTAPRP